MGLEIIDWLISRGAKKVIISSRNGVKTGYQSMRIDYWKTCAVDVTIHEADTSTHEGVTQLLQRAESIGRVDAIFNLAAVNALLIHSLDIFSSCRHVVSVVGHRGQIIRESRFGKFRIGCQTQS